MKKVFIFDLDNTVWYGNYQRHGYIFAELLWKLRQGIPLGEKKSIPTKEFRKYWVIYTSLLHLTAPQQLNLFLFELEKDGVIKKRSKKEFITLRKSCWEWIDKRYWELVKNPKELKIFSHKDSMGKNISLVPNYRKVYKELIQAKIKDPSIKVYGLSLNLRHISVAVLKRLKIFDLFDDVFGVEWDKRNKSKTEVIECLLRKTHISRKKIVIFGDSIHDIQVAKKCRIQSVAISTGPTSFTDLNESNPDLLIKNWPSTTKDIYSLLQIPNQYFIGIDVGGTTTRIALVNNNGKIISLNISLEEKIRLRKKQILVKKGHISFLTPSIHLLQNLTPEQLQEKLILQLCQVIKAIKKCNSNLLIQKGGIAFAGIVDSNGIISKAADLYGEWGKWNEEGVIVGEKEIGGEFYLKERMITVFPEMEWTVINDVVAAGWKYGKDRRLHSLQKIALITISTGIGYVLISPADIDREKMEVVSIGHHVVDTSKEAIRCSCGGKGHLWAYASGKGFEFFLNRYIATQWRVFIQSSLCPPDLRKKKRPDKDFYINNEQFIKALKENDFFAKRIFKQQLLPKLGNVFSSLFSFGVDKVVVMGGFGIALGDDLQEGIATILSKQQKANSKKFNKALLFGGKDGLDGVIGVVEAIKHRGAREGVFWGKDKKGNIGFRLTSCLEKPSRTIFSKDIFHIKNSWLKKCLIRGKQIEKAIIVVDEKVSETILQRIKNYFKFTGTKFKIGVVKDNSSASIKQLIQTATNFKLGRKDPFLIIGGLTAYSAGGLVASVYRRNMPFIFIPIGLNNKKIKDLKIECLYKEVKIYACEKPVYVVIDTYLNSIKGENTEGGVNRLLETYPVVASDDVLSTKNITLKYYINPSVKPLVVVDGNVDNIYGKSIAVYFKTNRIPYDKMIVEATERNKTLDSVFNVTERIEGHDIVVAIGGGIAMDIAGFAASLKSIPYIRIPTTLLGNIDAGVGVKVGCNFEEHKNFLGDFYSPKVCINDTSFLKTLPRHHIQMGLSEIIKMGIICSSQLFSLVEKYHERLTNNRFQDKLLAHQVNDLAIYWMMIELQKNLHEENSLQRLVDFGHAFSPYIEVASEHRIEHGQAVAIDMAICAQLAFLKGFCSQVTRDRILDLLLAIGLPIFDKICTTKELYLSMEKIRLHRGGKLHLPIPISIGEATFLNEFSELELEQTLAFLKEKNHKNYMMSWGEMFDSISEEYEVIKRDKPYEMWISNEKYPLCGSEEIIIGMLAAGICGTDLRVFSGERKVPAGRIGHEACAVILEVGKEAAKRGYKKGDVVVLDCNHPDPTHRDLHLDAVLGRVYKVPSVFVMSSPQRRVIPITQYIEDGKISFAQASILEPMTVALHSLDYLRKGKILNTSYYDEVQKHKAHDTKNLLKGKTVVIHGAGSIGVFMSMLLKVNKVKNIILVNRNRERLERAEEMLSPTITLHEDDQLVARLNEFSKSEGGIDYAIIASHSSSIQKAVQYIKDGGTILLVAGISKDATLDTDSGEISLYPIRHNDLREEVFVKGKKIILMGAHGTQEPLFIENLEAFKLGLFKEYNIEPSHQVSHVVSLQSLPTVFKEIERKQELVGERVGKVLVDFRLKDNIILNFRQYNTVFQKDALSLVNPYNTSIAYAQIVKTLSKSLISGKKRRNTFAELRKKYDEVITLLSSLISVTKKYQSERFSPNELAYLEKAFLFARREYQNMKFNKSLLPDGRWFIYHPLDVVKSFISSDVIRQLKRREIVEVIAGILLHDVLEYTSITSEILRNEFGEIVVNIAEDLSQDRTIESKYITRELLQKGKVEKEEKARIRQEANIEMKKEHYSRLIKYRRYSFSAQIKTIDNQVNYSLLKSLGIKKAKKEFDLFSSFVKETNQQKGLLNK